MADDVKDWLKQCTTCMKRKSPTGRHHLLATFPPVIAGTGSLWTFSTFVTDIDTSSSSLTTSVNGRRLSPLRAIKDKCADTVADVLVDKIILRFGMPLVIHSDQGREFENGLMKSLCTLLGCVTTRTAPYHPESDGMVERFNRTCLMMLSMFVNDRRDNWNELLPFVMYAYRTSVQESTGTSYAQTGNMTWRHTLLQLGYRTLWKLHMIMCAIRYIARPLDGRDYMTLKLSIASSRWDCGWCVTTLRLPKINWGLCASTVAFRPGSHVSDSDSSPSVDVSTWNNSNTPPSSSDIHLKLDQPIDLMGHIL